MASSAAEAVAPRLVASIFPPFPWFRGDPPALSWEEGGFQSQSTLTAVFVGDEHGWGWT